MFEIDAFLPLLLAFQDAPSPAPDAGIVRWLLSIPWFAWIAIVAIVSGCMSSAVAACFKHRERMAMISQGMHPDNAEAVREFKAAHPEL
jgi:hypothetical protein